MGSSEKNKETMKMTTKKLLTALTTILLVILPVHGIGSVANAASVDLSLSTFEINGQSVEDGDTFIVAKGTTSVTVNAIPTDSNASVAVTGDTGLLPGDNSVLTTVTGSDSSQITYTVYVYVSNLDPTFSGDTSLSSVTINGVSVTPNQLIDIEPLTTAVTVVVVTNDSKATSLVSGSRDLVTGTNTVTVTVTAEDGSSKDYTYKVRVPALSSDVVLSEFTVNGQVVKNNSRLYLAPGTTGVIVKATPNDPTSSVEVTGASGLVPGSNSLKVKVTAVDGSNFTYNVTLMVDVPSSISTLAKFTVNGAKVVDGGRIFLPAGTEEVTVVALASDAAAQVEVTGNTSLKLGDNTLTAVVTAEDGTSTTYTVTLKVLADDDTSLAVFQYDGEDIESGASFDLEYGSTSVVDLITATPTSAKATVDLQGATDLKSGKNIVKVVVTAEDGSTETYRLIVNVAQSNVTTIDSITIGGEEVTGGSVTLKKGTKAGLVNVVTTDPFATYEVEDNTGWNPGENTVTVTVTAADGVAQEEFTYTVNVELYSAVTGAEILVNGDSVSDGDTVTLLPGTSKVLVKVNTEDPLASYAIEGGSELELGENPLVVTVTAEDGVASQEYNITLVVSASDIAFGKSFKINGQLIKPLGQIKVAPYTESVDVFVETLDPNATFELSGDADLVAGENTVTVTITAEDGVTTKTYTFTVIVPLSSDVSLSEFTVNGNAALDGDTITLAPYADSVEVVATPTDENISAEITGDSGLVNGSNTLNVLVTAPDGTKKTYKVALVVPLSPDTSLASFSVGGVDVVNGDTVTVDPYTTETDVVAEANDSNSVVVITGGSALVIGNNTVSVKVTAPNGDVKTYVVTVVVPKGNDTSLSVLSINDNDAADGDVIDLEPYTTSLDVKVETTDPNATFTVTKPASLSYGANTVVVEVTAQNGVDKLVSTITVNLPKGNDVTLSKFKVNGNDVADGDEVELPYLTTTATIEVATTDPNASAVVTGGTGLKSGSNLVTVEVTAHDGTKETYSISLVVRLSNVVTLSTFTVNGSAVIDGSVVNLVPLTKSATIVAVATDADATVEISGGTDLEPGDNDLVVTVTAADGETIVNYTVNLKVDLNHDASLSTFTINGSNVKDGDTVNLVANTKDVELVAVPTDADATVDVSGDADLAPGVNTLVVTVTAADGITIVTYKVTLDVALSSDNSLLMFSINGNAVKDGDVITLEPYADAVELEAETTDENATLVATGDSDLKNGENLLVVTVTAHNGAVKLYTVKLIVPLSTDTSLSEFTVNGDKVTDGSTVLLDPYTEDVEVSAVATDENLEPVIDGGSALKTGDNTLKVTVTAPSGAIKVYTVTLRVQISKDTSLSTFTVNGDDVADLGTVNLDPYTTEVEVEATATDENAVVVITGGTDLVTGLNLLSVKVTAPSGDSKTYLVFLKVAISANTNLSSFTVNGDDVDNGSIVELEAYTADVEVDVETEDANSTFTIVGGSKLVTGLNSLVVTVKAPSGATKVYTVTLKVLVSTDTSLESFTVNDNDVADGDVTDLEAYSTSAAVVVKPTDLNATYTITGATGLKTGFNTLTVVVTAPSGDKQTYTVTLNVVVSNETDLDEILVYGNAVEEGGSVDLQPGATALPVSATPKDKFAKVEISGNEDLQPGENTVTITVTAPDGTVEEHTFVANVAILSSDFSIESMTAAGLDVSDGGQIEVPVGTRAVRVVVVTTDPLATYSVEGNDELDPAGENPVVVTVTAPNGDSRSYQFNVMVQNPANNADTGVESITIGDKTVLDGDTVTLDAGTRAVQVTVVTTDPFATFTVEGNTNMEAGENPVVVTVTAGNGDTATYSITVLVKEPEVTGDVTYAIFQVNSKDVEDAATLDLPYGSKRVNVKVETTDAYSTYMVEGDGSATPLVVGEQDLVLTITAANGDSATYTVTLNVLPLSDNTNLNSDFGVTVNNEQIDLEILNSSRFYSVARTVTSLAVAATPEDLTSDLQINGKDMLPGVARNFSVVVGVNELTLVVTSQSGKSAQYKLKIFVGGADATLKSTKIGNTPLNFIDGSANTPTLPVGTTSATLYVEPNMALKTANTAGTDVLISGDGVTATKSATAFTWNITGLIPGDNPVTITVVPGDPDAESVDYSLNISVALSNDTTLKSFKINGAAVAIGSTQILPLGTTEVELDAETNNVDATFEVEGGDALVPGINALKVNVTAADGFTTATYTVTAIVPKAVEKTAIPFKADVITVDKAKNADGLKALTALVTKLTKAKATLVKVEIATDFVVAKEKNKKAGAARAAAIQKALQAAKLTNAKTAVYSLIPLKVAKAKGATVNIYYY